MKFSKSVMSSCISGHLDVSPCHAVIICHTPKTLESASVMCSLQSNIYSAQNYSKYLPLLSRSKHMRGGKTVPTRYNGWVHHKASTEDDHITTCFVTSVPLCWFPGDDPGLVTLYFIVIQTPDMCPVLLRLHRPPLYL